MALLGLLVAKFALYCAFFLWTPRLLKFKPRDPGAFALKWAAIRLVLGLLAIVPAYAVTYALGKAGVPGDAELHAGIFSVRALIWAGIAAQISHRHMPGQPVPWVAWIGLGLLLNLAVDTLTHVAGIDDFKFFC